MINENYNWYSLLPTRQRVDGDYVASDTQSPGTCVDGAHPLRTPTPTCSPNRTIRKLDRADDLQEKLDAAHSQIDDLKAKAANLQDASDNLKQQMDRFETENWRDVVGDAQSAASDVDDAQGDLKESADDADGSESGDDAK